MGNTMAHIPLQVPDGLDISDTGSDGNVTTLVAGGYGNTGGNDVPDNTTSADEDDEAGIDQGNTDTSTTSDRPGIDDVLSHVRDNMGKHAEGVIRALMRDDTQVRQLDADRRRLREAIDEVEALREDIESDTNPDPMDQALREVPPDQLQLLEAYMEQQGYVKQADLNEKDKEALVDKSNREAIKMFGDDFGRMDGDEFVLNEVAQENMATVYDRCVTSQNFDYRDMFVLGNFPTLLESAHVTGRNEAIEEMREKNGQRVARATRGSVAVSNAGGTAKNHLYNRADYKEGGGSKPGGFSRISDVLDKARREAQTA